MNRLTPLEYNLVADGVKSQASQSTGGITQTLSECQTGYCGQIKYPARLDHSHPLNVMATGDFGQGKTVSDYVKPIGATASLGTQPYYARVDHVHTLPTGNGLVLDAPYWSLVAGDPNDIATSPFNSQKDTTTWTRSVSTRSGKPCGFEIYVLTKAIRFTNVGKDGFYFRKMTVDENGCIRKIGAEEFAFGEVYR